MEPVMSRKLARSLWMILSLLFLITACSSDVAGAEGAEALLASKKGFDPVSEYAYVGHLSSPFVSVIDVPSMTKIAQIDFAGYFAAPNIAIAPDGLVAYVTVRGPSGPAGLAGLSKVNLATNSVVATVALVPGSRPMDVALTPTGHRIFVTQIRGRSVAAIDARTLDVLAVIPLTDENDAANGIAMGPGGRHVFVSNEYSGRVHVIDTESLELVETIETGLIHVNELAVTQSGRFIFGTANGDDEVIVIDAESFDVVRTIPVGDHPVGIAIPPNGKEAYVVHYRGNLLTVIDTRSLEVVDIVPLSDGPRRIEVNTNGRLAIGTSASSLGVTLIDVVNRTILDRESTGGSRPFGVAFLRGPMRTIP